MPNIKTLTPVEQELLNAVNGSEKKLNTLKQSKAPQDELDKAQRTLDVAKTIHTEYQVTLEKSAAIDLEHKTMREKELETHTSETKQRFVDQALIGVPISEHMAKMELIERDWKKHEHLV